MPREQMRDLRQRAGCKIFRSLGPVDTIGMKAAGASFSEFQERGVTHTGVTRRKNSVGWSGYRVSASEERQRNRENRPLRIVNENLSILRCHPRRWTRHSRSPPPHLDRFSLITPSIPIVLTGSDR